MNEIIEKLLNIPFVTGIRGLSEVIENPNKSLIIDVSDSLITEKDSIITLFDLLKSQSFFEWVVSITE